MSKPEADIYLQNVLPHIPRVLSLLDRSPLSPSSGCFHRSYWLHRTSDFPSGICQIGFHPLALLWANQFPDNIYYNNAQLLEWIEVALKYTIKIQHKDGSFDEWYPNERGWAGPTGYILNALTDTFLILNCKFDEQLKKDILMSIKRAANFLASNDEKFILANHYAISLLPIYKSYTITNDAQLLAKFEAQLDEFFSHCNDEGWGIEYDGMDAGYLLGTLSFLASLHKYFPSERIENFARKSLDFFSYNIFPNGNFGGELGSSNTTHYYPFALEYWSHKFPIAKKLSDFYYDLLNHDQILTPSTQEDHYLLYRLPDFILASIERKNFKSNHNKLPMLPFEHDCFEKFFPLSKIYIKNDQKNYWICNLHKGGAIKSVNLHNTNLTCQNSGWIAKSNNKIISSLWNDDTYQYTLSDNTISIEGNGHYVASNLFTPVKNIIFRSILLALCWNRYGAYIFKVIIRKILMVGAKQSPIYFKREIIFEDESVKISDKINKPSRIPIHECIIGGNLPTRFVPQSRYFHHEELMFNHYKLSSDELHILNTHNSISITTHLGRY